MPVSDMSLRKAYQEAEQLWAALKQCALEEGEGNTRLGYFFRSALSSVEGICSVLREEATSLGTQLFPVDKRKPGSAWVDEDGVVRFRIEDVPPRYRSLDAEARRDINRLWTSTIVGLARQAGISPRFRRAKVAVTVAAQYKWDLDNRDLKPILDGLRRALVIQDDDCETVSLELRGIRLPAGERGEYTEVTVWGEQEDKEALEGKFAPFPG